jgi:hypothetical protein
MRLGFAENHKRAIPERFSEKRCKRDKVARHPRKTVITITEATKSEVGLEPL